MSRLASGRWHGATCPDEPARWGFLLFLITVGGEHDGT